MFESSSLSLKNPAHFIWTFNQEGKVGAAAKLMTSAQVWHHKNWKKNKKIDTFCNFAFVHSINETWTWENRLTNNKTFLF